MNNKEFNVKLGQLLKDARNEKGMTQPELAKKLGVSKQAVFYWESGRRGMDAGTLFDFCDAIGADVNELTKPLRNRR